jgi:hypothetical protein
MGPWSGEPGEGDAPGKDSAAPEWGGWVVIIRPATQRKNQTGQEPGYFCRSATRACGEESVDEGRRAGNRKLNFFYFSSGVRSQLFTVNLLAAAEASLWKDKRAVGFLTV